MSHVRYPQDLFSVQRRLLSSLPRHGRQLLLRRWRLLAGPQGPDARDPGPAGLLPVAGDAGPARAGVLAHDDVHPVGLGPRDPARVPRGRLRRRRYGGQAGRVLRVDAPARACHATPPSTGRVRCRTRSRSARLARRVPANRSTSASSSPRTASRASRRPTATCSRCRWERACSTSSRCMSRPHVRAGRSRRTRRPSRSSASGSPGARRSTRRSTACSVATPVPVPATAAPTPVVRRRLVGRPRPTRRPAPRRPRSSRTSRRRTPRVRRPSRRVTSRPTARPRRTSRPRSPARPRSARRLVTPAPGASASPSPTATPTPSPSASP